jgi:hypothetical protein
VILHPDQLFECDWTDCCDYLQAPHTSLIKSFVNMAAVIALLTTGVIANTGPPYSSSQPIDMANDEITTESVENFKMDDFPS